MHAPNEPASVDSGAVRRFGDFELDPQARELKKRGRRIRLQEQPFQVLALLLERAGKVVTREELHQKLWPSSVYVDFEHGLNNAIGRLREALGDVAATPHFIETLPRLGYRFIHPIEEPAAPLAATAPTAAAATAAPRLSRRVAIRALAAAVIAIAVMLAIGRWTLTDTEVKSAQTTTVPVARSIAVLPFVDMSAAQDQTWFSDGVAEEVLNRLAQAGELRVISRTSSFSFRNRPLDMPEIGSKLGVSHVLEGSVRRSGDRVRITAQLIEVSSNSHVWSETFDRTMGDLFAVQDEIAAAVAAALQVTLAGGDARHRIPTSAQAYESLLQSEFFYSRRAPGDIELSVKHLEDAVSIDPGYARAWAALAGAYAMQAWNGHPSAAALREQQGKAAQRAVELDPGLAVAHARLGQYFLESSHRRKGEEHLKKAIALNPDEPLVTGYTCSIAVLHGELDRATEVQQRVVARDPLSVTERINLGVLYLAGGRPDEAVAVFRDAQKINPEFGSQIEAQIGRALVLQKRFDEAHSAFARLPEGETRDYGLALLYQSPDRRAEADAALARLVERADDLDNIHLAEVYAFRGMLDEAFATLQQLRIGLESDPNFASTHVFHLQLEMGVSPFLNALHADPRWAAMMAASG